MTTIYDDCSKEELLQIVSEMQKDLNDSKKEMHRDRLADAIEKIRAEIMQLDYDTESIDYDHNDMPQTEIVHTICREEVLQIIDKYKAKVRENNDKGRMESYQR